ncbi:DUF4406 domain-containing protein [Pseudomonas rhizosphaerae]|uniref:DUF4406 domain-containing protein n=1 Tax=Pseudomonas rhizosphaerae TaxID=216142 RepID=UPI002B493281|nr:DUF4406 domain-containing protein [Pseudomonas rhizosphaerae]MEB2870352.1 DUF4406 domain-containing protein [Pseudomonas rhizosphaerae]
MRIYLCGPMTGIADYNYPAFAAEAARLRSLGYVVVSPAEINPEGGTWQDCMKKDIAHLVTCDVVAKLPGWALSRGANVEIRLALELNISVVMAACITDAHTEVA